MQTWLDDIHTTFVRTQIRGRPALAREYVRQLYLLERMLRGNWSGFGGYPGHVYKQLRRTYPAEAQAITYELTEGVVTDLGIFAADRAAFTVAWHQRQARLEEEAAAPCAAEASCPGGLQTDPR